jgi:uncharacterized membrane protein YhhN
VRPADRIDRTLAILALVAPVLYLLLLAAKPYPGDIVLKTSLCVLLALLAWRRQKYILTVALLFSAIGDALLGIGARLFVPALASFLITHLLYVALFLMAAKLRFARLSPWRMALLAAVPLFAAAYTFVLWPHLGNLALPVTCYIAAIVAMAVLSLRVPVTIVPIGAVLFVTSDSLISLEKFMWHAQWLGAAVWITYAAAQLLIAYGLLSPTKT